MLCPKCGKELEKRSLVAHRQTQHVMVKGGLVQKYDKEGGSNNPTAFRMAIKEKAGTRPCPVEGCSDQAATRMAMWVNFWHWNFRDTGVILDEGNIYNPQCHLCIMLVPWRSLNGMYQRTAQCKNEADQKQRCLSEEEERAVTSRAFIAYGIPLDMVTYF